MSGLNILVRVLIALIILRIVLRMMFPPPSRQRPGAQKGQERLGGELVRDPQCGTYIPKASAIVLGSGDGAKYFCSVEHRDAWLREGQRS